ncbi:MAG: hypothetical protein E4H18_01840 [Hyphomicrobiales bacterium]|nr:MAG: hypothetical protein E4H18_01840 [Hyphomicrobiales bacterium]
MHAAAGQSNVGAEAAASSATRLSELMASLNAQVSRLHPLPLQKKTVVALKMERAAEESSGESTQKDSHERRAGGERRGLRPVR